MFVAHMSMVMASVRSMPQQDTAVIDGYITAQAKREQGEEYREARKVGDGDLNGDGVPDVAVLYTIEGQRGSNNYIQYLAVFVRANGKLVAITHAKVGGRFYRSVESLQIKDKAILLETLDYTQKDAACCPSKKSSTEYSVVANKLRERKGR